MSCCRQSGDSMLINSSSSIALLQQRFRQLQRAKEMRQLQESLRLISTASQQLRPTTNYLVSPFHSQPHTSFLHHNTHHTPTLFANLCSSNQHHLIIHSRPSPNFDDSDVDTSLHL